MQPNDPIPNYRISHRGNVVENVSKKVNTFGCRGAHVRPIAKPHGDFPFIFVARLGAHRDALLEAARELNIVIYRQTRKRGLEIITANTNQ